MSSRQRLSASRQIPAACPVLVGLNLVISLANSLVLSSLNLLATYSHSVQLLRFDYFGYHHKAQKYSKISVSNVFQVAKWLSEFIGDSNPPGVEIKPFSPAPQRWEAILATARTPFSLTVRHCQVVCIATNGAGDFTYVHSSHITVFYAWLYPLLIAWRPSVNSWPPTPIAS